MLLPLFKIIDLFTIPRLPYACRHSLINLIDLWYRFIDFGYFTVFVLNTSHTTSPNTHRLHSRSFDPLRLSAALFSVFSFFSPIFNCDHRKTELNLVNPSRRTWLLTSTRTQVFFILWVYFLWLHLFISTYLWMCVCLPTCACDRWFSGIWFNNTAPLSYSHANLEHFHSFSSS